MDRLQDRGLRRPSAPRGPRRFLVALASLVAIALLSSACDAVATHAPAATPTVDQLLATLSTSASPGDRAGAAEALGEAGDSRAVGPLSAALDDSATDVRIAAAVALGRIGDATAAVALARLLATGSSKEERAAASTALTSIGNAAIPALIDQLAADAITDHAIAGALASFGSAAVAPLKAALTGDAAASRAGAAEALGRMGSAGIPTLASALHDSTLGVRLAAVDGLYIVGADAVPNLITALKDREAKVRSAAANRLGRLGDRQAEKSLVALLKDSVWKTASIALARLYQGEATSLLHYLDAKSTLRVYFGLIRLGEDGTDKRLASALLELGDLEMAEEYLNCGNDRLEAAAHTWADQHGYEVLTMPGSAGGTWGSGLSD